jgi:hypothetical protein
MSGSLNPPGTPEAKDRKAVRLLSRNGSGQMA